MDNTDAVRCLAATFAARAAPLRRSELRADLPYLRIARSPLNPRRFMVQEAGNYEQHPNADRMLLVAAYLNTHALPFVDPAANLHDAFFNIELHDSYTYLPARGETSPDTAKYDGVLTFARRIEDTGPVLLPDPYQMTNYGGLMHAYTDSIPAAAKKDDRAVFVGATTGDPVPARNARIQLCLWASENADVMHAKVTKVAQMSKAAMEASIGADACERIVAPPYSLAAQHEFRYHLNMDGNTCRFDVWPFASQSVVLKMRSPDMLWWHPLMREGREFVGVTSFEDVRTQRARLQADGKQRTSIVASANAFARHLLQPTMHHLYTAALLEHLGGNR
jgi:hypothetical protein